MEYKLLRIIAILYLAIHANLLHSQVPSYVPTNGLVGWWPFDGNANDLSVNGNNGIVNGAVLSPDRFNDPNKSYYFSSSGCNTRIDINNFNYSGSVSAFSISFWLKRVGNGCISPRLFEFGNGQGWGVNWVNGNSSMDWVSNLNIPNGTWFHLVYVLEPGSLKSYVNGVFNSQYSITNSIASWFAQQVCFGRMNHPSFDAFNGNLDDVGTWNRALTDCEIQQLYLSQLNPLSVDAGPDMFVCSGDQITINATGASTYTWTGGIQNGVPFYPQSNQTYIVTGTNPNGCTGLDTVNVVVVPSPQISTSADTICPGDMVTLTTNVGYSPCDNLSGTLANGIVGYWPFCGNANDLSGNGNHGTVVGSILTIDRFGNANNAYLFDGVNDYISLTNSLPNTSTFTISAWVYHTKGANYSGILSDANTSPGNDLFYNMNNQSIGVKADKNGSLLFQCPLPEVGFNPSPLASSLNLGNQWKHIVLSVTASETNLYVNSTLVTTLNIGGSNVGNHALHPVFGKITDGAYSIQFFGGNLDDIGIWNRTLTTAEIQQLYNQGQTTLLWSPGGETTPTIIVSPTTTTNYTCTATTNGISCSESQTIEVLPTSSSNIVVVECNDYTLNGQTYTQSGIYTQVITNAAGCDSTITLDLTLNFPPVTPNIYVQNQTTLSTDDIPGLNYQWFFCTDLIDVPGATNPIFTPTANAYYAVVVSNACGSDTSACADVSSIGLNDFGTQNVLLYPNPTNLLINVIVPSQLLGQDWELMDIRGRLVLSGQVEKESTIIQISGLARGSYWLKIQTSHPIQVVKN
jgi:hypothetical protein